MVAMGGEQFVSLTLRFVDYEFYDPQLDRVSLRLQAITNIGTWYADIEAHTRKVGLQRKAFQDYVLVAMGMGQQPKKVTLG